MICGGSFPTLKQITGVGLLVLPQFRGWRFPQNKLGDNDFNTTTTTTTTLLQDNANVGITSAASFY